jgi:hypothetical protein
MGLPRFPVVSIFILLYYRLLAAKSIRTLARGAKAHIATMAKNAFSFRRPY